MWAFAAVTILSVALLVYVVTSRDNGPELNASLVVVPPFENRTGEPELDGFADMTAEWVAEAVQEIQGVVLVPLGDARQIVAGLVEEGSADRLRRVAERTGAGWVISGVMAAPGDSLEFRVEIIDVARWAREQGVDGAGPKEAPQEAILELANRVSGALAYQFDPTMGDVERGGQVLPKPPTIEAFREHRLGYKAYDREDRDASFRHHMAAFDLDTTLVRAVVAAAFMTPDHAVKDSLAGYASQRRHMLSLRGRRDLDILLEVVDHDLQGVLRAMRQDAAMNRTGFSAVTHAWAALVVNRPGEAVEALSHYDPYLGWRIGEAHAYWDYLTRALHMLGDFEGELAEAQAGRAMYPARSDLMVAEVRSLAALGRAEDVMELIQEAVVITETPAVVLMAAGEELRAHGLPQASIEVFEIAIEELTVRQGGEVAAPNEGPGVEVTPRSPELDIARALYGAERFREAQDLAMTLVGEDRDGLAALGLVGEDRDGLAALGLVGVTAARLGDEDLAKEIDGQLSAMVRPGRPWDPLYLRARIAAVLGEPDEAMSLLTEAFSRGLRYWDPIHREMDFESLRERPDYQALMRTKG